MIEVSFDEVKKLFSIPPFDAHKQLNCLITERARESCYTAGHVPLFKRLATITNADGSSEFEEKQFGYVCRLCGCRLRATQFEEY